MSLTVEPNVVTLVEFVRHMPQLIVGLDEFDERRQSGNICYWPFEQRFVTVNFFQFDLGRLQL